MDDTQPPTGESSSETQYQTYIDPAVEEKRPSEGDTLQAVMQLAQAASQQHLSQFPERKPSPEAEAKRPLSASKRAAQNRAAQRAFRERRDKYVKELEGKAAQLESALRAAEESRQRYVDALTTIDGLRQDNHSLRVALAALGGHVAGPSPQNVREEQQSLEGLSAVAVAAAEKKEEQSQPEKQD